MYRDGSIAYPGAGSDTVRQTLWLSTAGAVGQATLAVRDAFFVTGGLRVERNDGFTTSRFAALPALGASWVRPLGVGAGAGGREEEWVETHAGRGAAHDAAAHAGTIDDIPDVDDADADAAGALGGLSLGGAGGGHPEIPDMDEIPDMEEDLEEGEDEATAAPKAAAPASGAGDAV